MTPEQVSALSDTELNRAMYDHYWIVDSVEPFDEFFNSIVGPDKLNYLEDYNLTMPLAIEANLCIELYNNKEYPHDKCWVYSLDGITTSRDKNPLRAICECLVLIALADHS